MHIKCCVDSRHHGGYRGCYACGPSSSVFKVSPGSSGNSRQVVKHQKELQRGMKGFAEGDEGLR